MIGFRSGLAWAASDLIYLGFSQPSTVCEGNVSKKSWLSRSANVWELAAAILEWRYQANRLVELLGRSGSSAKSPKPAIRRSCPSQSPYSVAGTQTIKPRQQRQRPRLLAAFVVRLMMLSYSAAISSASPSCRINSNSRSASSKAAVTSCCTRAAASSSSCDSWMLR